MIAFPIWVIRLTHAGMASLRYACDEAGRVVAFVELDAAVDYLTAHNMPGMLIHRLKRAEALLLVADMHEYKVPAICLNPRSDGDGANIVPISALAGLLTESQ